MATVNFCDVSLKKCVFLVPRCDFSPFPNVSLLRCKNAEIETDRAEIAELLFSIMFLSNFFSA